MQEAKSLKSTGCRKDWERFVNFWLTAEQGKMWPKKSVKITRDHLMWAKVDPQK